MHINKEDKLNGIEPRLLAERDTQHVISENFTLQMHFVTDLEHAERDTSSNPKERSLLLSSMHSKLALQPVAVCEAYCRQQLSKRSVIFLVQTQLIKQQGIASSQPF